MAKGDVSSLAGPVVCGTDFSALAQQSAVLAHALAERLGVPLHLLHVSEDGRSGGESLREAGARLGSGVMTECLPGHPDEALVARADQLSASLLVIGSLGRRNLQDWLLGSTAERTVRCARVPCLVVRQPERLSDWLRGARPLRVMLAISLDDPVEPSLQWVKNLSRAGSVEPFAVLVAGGPHLNDEWYESEHDRLQEACGLPRPDCHVVVWQWPVDEHLMTMARRENADLIVMGRHLRTGLERLWKGSVSMSVLKRTELSVAVVSGPPR